MNRGQKALRRLTAGPTGQPQREIARRCKVDQSAVSLWLRGERLPEFHSRMALEREYGIALTAWDEEEGAIA